MEIFRQIEICCVDDVLSTTFRFSAFCAVHKSVSSSQVATHITLVRVALESCYSICICTPTQRNTEISSLSLTCQPSKFAMIGIRGILHQPLGALCSWNCWWSSCSSSSRIRIICPHLHSRPEKRRPLLRRASALKSILVCGAVRCGGFSMLNLQLTTSISHSISPQPSLALRFRLFSTDLYGSLPNFRTIFHFILSGDCSQFPAIKMSAMGKTRC